MSEATNDKKQTKGGAKFLTFTLLLTVPVALTGCNSSYDCDSRYEYCQDDDDSSTYIHSSSGSSKSKSSSSVSSGSSYKGFGSSGKSSSVGG